MIEDGSDWGDSFDDMDGGDWEEYMGGPDDCDLEPEYIDQSSQNNIDDYYSNDDRENEYYSNYEVINNIDSGGGSMPEYGPDESRKIEIIRWLEESSLARKFRRTKGFYIRRGPLVRLRGGGLTELMDWLFQEGLRHLVVAGDYSVVYSNPNSKDGERLSFYCEVIDAPFFPLKSSKFYFGDTEEIPF